MDSQRAESDDTVKGHSVIVDPLALERKLQQLVDRTVARSQQVRHALMGVARTDGSFRWTGAAGAVRDDGVPATATTPYAIASVTKLYTATAVLLLHEQGRLAIDDRLVDYLPPDLVTELHTVDGVDLTGEITLRHLLAQTSGLADYYEGRARRGRSVADRLQSGEAVAMDLAGMLRLVREELPPHGAPLPMDAEGRKANYGNTGYQLLGAVIEHVTGQPLHVAFDELLFHRLGLADTYVYPHRPARGPAAGDIAAVWAKHQIMSIDTMLRALGPDGGLVSVLDDQLDFMGALVTGRVFEDRATLALMHERWNRIFFPLEYGLGTMRYALPRWASFPRRVPVLVGHSGSTGTWLYHCPELDVVLAGTLDQALPRSRPFRLLPRVVHLVQQHTSRDGLRH